MAWPIALVIAALSLLLGSLAVSVPALGLIGVLAGIVAALVTFFSPKTGLGILVFSMLLSPEIGIGQVGYRDVVIRYDDILLMVVFFSWFARSAIRKEESFFFSTPVNLPIFLYTVVCVLSTASGIIAGRLHFAESVFYLLKYVEYFMLFLLVVNIADTEKSIRGYLICGAITAVIVVSYGIIQYSIFGKGFRVSLPFESQLGKAEWGEPATAGGYYLILMAVLLGFYTQAKGLASKLSIASLLVVVPAFILTLSRASYIAFSAMLSAAFLLTKRKKINLAVIVAVLIVSTILFLPSIRDAIQERVLFTFSTQARPLVAFQFANTSTITLESSAAARVMAWQRILFEAFPAHPLLGWGIPGVGLVDSQIPLVLGETGLVGLSLFIWMLFRIWKVGAGLYKKSENDRDKVLGFSLCVMLIALIAQTLGVNTFIIVRVMEPFWFLVGLVAKKYSQNMRIGNNSAVPDIMKGAAGGLPG